ncbi:MAG: DUF2520 domain-containing protein [Candidatus Acidiferrales bacterium]
MKRSVSIVGAGRLGRTLARRLHRRGWRIVAVVTRSAPHSRAAVRAIGAGTPFAALTRHVLRADVILLATPDDALAAVAQELAQLAGKNCRGKIILHTSGALDRGVLRPLAQLGAWTGSLHPMQTFTGRSQPELNGVIFAIEGHPRARRAARAIALSLGGVPVVVSGRAKPAYHAAGVLVAGHALALTEAATQVLLQLGFTRRRAAQALLPLLRQTLANFEQHGPRAAWTGPIARRDYSTVARHRAALRKYPAEINDAYAALARLSARVLAKDAAKTLPQIDRALKIPRRNRQ